MRDNISSLTVARLKTAKKARMESPSLASCLWLVKRKSTFCNVNSYFDLPRCWEVFPYLLYALFNGCTQN